MTLDDRIAYWRGRAKLAKRFGLEKEAAGAALMADVLSGAQKAQKKADDQADRIHAAMPEELYGRRRPPITSGSRRRFTKNFSG